MADHNTDDFEQQLSRLSLARQSDTYLPKGLQAAQPPPATSSWRTYLPVALTAALVLSVTANIFQLVHNRQSDPASPGETMAQCNTPALASPASDITPYRFATSTHELQPLGMC